MDELNLFCRFRYDTYLIINVCFHLAIGGVEVRNGSEGLTGERVLEDGDGFLGNGESGGFLGGVVGKGDSASHSVDLGEIGEIDDMPSADTKERNVVEVEDEMLYVLHACKDLYGTSAAEAKADIVAIRFYIHHFVHADACELISGA